MNDEQLTDPTQRARHIVLERMLPEDAFSQWLGIRVLHVAAGVATVQMTVRPEMVNGFGIAHGGISFSLADSAFAFACNGAGIHSVSIECSISHVAPIHVGDVLRATCQQEYTTARTGLYYVTVTNQRDEKVALFRGTCYRKKQTW